MSESDTAPTAGGAVTDPASAGLAGGLPGDGEADRDGDELADQELIGDELDEDDLDEDALDDDELDDDELDDDADVVDEEDLVDDDELLDDEAVDDEGFDDGPEAVDEANRILGGRANAVLGYLARNIVDDPDGVSVVASEDRGGVRLELFVAPGDMGKVIGRKGRVAQAIRAIVRAAAAQDGITVFVDIVD